MRSISKQEYPELKTMISTVLMAYVDRDPHGVINHRHEVNPWYIFNLNEQFRVLSKGVGHKTRRQLKNLAKFVATRVSPLPGYGNHHTYTNYTLRGTRLNIRPLEELLFEAEEMVKGEHRVCLNPFYGRFVKKLRKAVSVPDLSHWDFALYRFILSDVVFDMKRHIVAKEERMRDSRLFTQRALEASVASKYTRLAVAAERSRWSSPNNQATFGPPMHYKAPDYTFKEN